MPRKGLESPQIVIGKLEFVFCVLFRGEVLRLNVAEVGAVLARWQSALESLLWVGDRCLSRLSVCVDMASAQSAAASAPSAAGSTEERIAVCVRLRPFNAAESASGAHRAWQPMKEFQGHLQQFAKDGSAISGSAQAFGEMLCNLDAHGIRSCHSWKMVKTYMCTCVCVCAFCRPCVWRGARHGFHLRASSPQDHSLRGRGLQWCEYVMLL